MPRKSRKKNTKQPKWTYRVDGYYTNGMYFGNAHPSRQSAVDQIISAEAIGCSCELFNTKTKCREYTTP